MIPLRTVFILGLIFNLSFSFAEKDDSPQLPDVWATLVDYYPQNPEFSKKIWEAKKHLLGEHFQGLFQFWLKRNKNQFQTINDNFLGYSYRKIGNQIELSWRQGFEAPNRNTIEKILVLIHGSEKNPELYAVLGDVLALNNSPQLACRAYAKAIKMGHPQPDRLKEMQIFAFKRAGVSNLADAVEEILALFAEETTVIADWQKQHQEYLGKPPFWDHQLRTWAVPQKKEEYHEQRLKQFQLIGGIVLASITLVIALLLNQVFIKRLRPMNPKAASAEVVHHHH